MKLELGLLTGENFQSFKNLSLNFSNLNKSMVLIQGENRDDGLSSSNGAGKSAVLEAISWVLFGTTFRPLRYADEIIHLQENSCFVVLDVIINGKALTVKRTKVRNSPAALNLYDSDQELLKDSDTKSKQKQLESILGFNFSTFTNSVMFHLDYVAFPELRPAERAEILTEIGNLEIYAKASMQAKSDSSQLALEIHSMKGNISTVKQIISQLKQDDYDIKIEKWASDNTAEIRRTRREIMNLTNELTEAKQKAQDQIEQLGKESLNIKSEKDKLQTDVDNKTKNLTNIEELEQSLIQLTKDEAVLETEISHSKKDLKVLQIERNELQHLKRGKCPICQQFVTVEHVDTCVKEILKKETHTLSQISEKNASQTRLIALKTQVNNELLNHKRVLAELDRLKRNVVELDKQLIRKDAEIKQLSSSLQLQDEHHSKILSEKEKALENLRNAINPYIELKAAQQKRIVEKELEIESLNKDLDRLIKNQNYVEFFVEGFKKIKLMLFDDLVNRLNELTLDFLFRYTSELSVNISCERQTKTGVKDEVHIEVNKPEGSISYAAYSGGERQKIKLAISLALAQLIEELCDRECDLIFFDEPNNGLDDIGKKSNFEIFSDLVSQGKSVIVIDHDAHFQNSFDYVITALKENGYSQLIVN